MKTEGEQETTSELRASINVIWSVVAQPTSTSCFVLLSCIAYTASSWPTLDECSGDEFGLKRPTNGPDARTYAGTTSPLAPIFRCENAFSQ